MSGYVDRRNTRADYTALHGLKTDEGGFIKYGPSLYSGRETLKDFEYVTTVCPECPPEENGAGDEEPIVCWVDDVGEDICPECGMVCSNKLPVSHGDRKFIETRGSHNPAGPSLAPPPVPDANSDPEFYGMGDFEL